MMLDPKTRELIAVAVAVTRQCDGCITVHTDAALKCGAAREELAEALGVAISVNAGALACVQFDDAFANGIHRSCYFIANHARNLGCVGIDAHARQEIREVDAAGLDANANLSGPWARVRRFAQLQDLWRARFCGPNLSHCPFHQDFNLTNLTCCEDCPAFGERTRGRAGRVAGRSGPLQSQP